MAVYGCIAQLPSVDNLRVGDEIVVDVREVGADDKGAYSVILTVEDIYEAAPGVTEVAWTVSHMFKGAICEVDYDSRTGETNVTIYAEE